VKHIRVDHIIKPAAGVAYVYGIRPDDGARRPEDLSSGEIAAAKMAHPEWSTKSAVVLRCLTFLDLFSGAVTARRGGPPATGADGQ
jgi:hypothetical protein